MDDDVTPATRAFADLDHLHHFMDSIDANGHILLNPGLYFRLKHALYPSEIAALDIDGVAIVGSHKYVISASAVSRINLEEVGGKLETEMYHGKSGHAYLDEFAAVANNIGTLEDLDNFQFKDPEIESIYVRLKNKTLDKTTNIDTEYYGPVGTTSFPFSDPTTGILNVFEGGPMSATHDRGYIFWNQSIGRCIRRAIAHTSLLFKPANTSEWYGHRYRHYGQNLSSYNSSNFVSTTVDGGKGKETCTGTFECTVRAGRKKRTGAISWHSAGYRSSTTSDHWHYDGPVELPSTIVLTSYDVNDHALN